MSVTGQLAWVQMLRAQRTRSVHELFQEPHDLLLQADDFVDAGQGLADLSGG